MTSPDRNRIALIALERANRFISNYTAEDHDDAFCAVREAKHDDTLMQFALACGILAAQARAERHGDRTQLHADAMALDSAWYRDRELALLDQRNQERRDG